MNAPALIVDGVPGPGCEVDYNLYYRAPALEKAAPSAKWLAGPSPPGRAGEDLRVPLVWRGRGDVPEKKKEGNWYWSENARAANAAGTAMTMQEYQKATRLDRNSLSADPIFVAPGIRDYRPRSASPCINAGSSDYVSPRDCNGQQRRTGSRPTIGAFEPPPAE